MPRMRLAFCCLISACALLAFFRAPARAADAPGPETATQGRALRAFVDGETLPLEQFGQCALGYLLLGGGEEQFASVRDISGDTAKPLQSRLHACRGWLIPRLQNQRHAGS